MKEKRKYDTSKQIKTEDIKEITTAPINTENICLKSVTKYYGDFKKCVQKFPLFHYTMLPSRNIA